MHRQLLLHLLRQHSPADANEQAMTQTTVTFVEGNPNAFERSLGAGHVTGSAWIVSPDRQQTLLIYHRKLDRWLQPGGHADGDTDVAAVALREAQEETGLTSLRLLSEVGEAPCIFDVDIHPIPARNDAPAHLHYDIRFLLEANPSEPFGFSEEIKGIRWIPLTEVSEYENSPSLLRLVQKTKKPV